VHEELGWWQVKGKRVKGKGVVEVMKKVSLGFVV
jgi:hypothetical protein